MVSDRAPSLASQLPQGAELLMRSVSQQKTCGSWLASDGAGQGNK